MTPDLHVIADLDWSDYENSDPITDVAACLTAYRAHNDHSSAKLAISLRLFDTLLGPPLVLERLKLTEPGTQLTPAILAQIFDVADVIVV